MNVWRDKLAEMLDRVWSSTSRMPLRRPVMVDGQDTGASVIREVERARREMDAAESYFNAVSDPQLVDHAIYVMEAAGRKYAYLIRKAKQEHVAVSDLHRIVAGKTAGV